MYSTIYPIDNKNLTEKENNVFGPNYPKLRSFNDSEVEYICILFIPINGEELIIDRDLSYYNDSVSDVYDYCNNELSINVYDGGNIKMSYKLDFSIDKDTYYNSKDTILKPNLYDIYERVLYKRLLFYV
ncbi:hypothetical protein HNS38_07310 [Lentimicrobium sp. L6]|uniref:hypothetical protein n=1 Tax=Lentimicrobium sp. L6 TaxID=2735916 RepID=UPI001557C3BB|nr:hypothetical protein [Lentimicrobium sp. L6]NPD84559.1 hypothetical protein [Lentimicrobium sp. L6]